MLNSFKYLLGISFTVLLFACGGEEQKMKPGEEKKIQEIKTEPAKISEIIRNPVNANEPLDTANVAKMVFDEKRYDFGTVNEGDVVRHKYKFTNTGKVPLIISEAKSTCGCTVPEWPKEAIPPGGTGEISDRFETRGKPNQQGKPITIFANTYPNQTILQLKGMVIPAKK